MNLINLKIASVVDTKNKFNSKLNRYV